MNPRQRDALCALLARLRNDGEELAPDLVALHEESVRWQVADDLRMRQLRDEVAALSAELTRPAEEQRGEFELHLTASFEFKPSARKAVKAAGGRYSDVRGDSHLHRFVTVPNGAKGRALSLSLLEANGQHGVRLFGRLRPTTCVIRSASGVDVVVSRTTWTDADLLAPLAAANAEGNRRRIAELTRALDHMEAQLRADATAETVAGGRPVSRFNVAGSVPERMAQAVTL